MPRSGSPSILSMPRRAENQFTLSTSRAKPFTGRSGRARRVEKPALGVSAGKADPSSTPSAPPSRSALLGEQHVGPLGGDGKGQILEFLGECHAGFHAQFRRWVPSPSIASCPPSPPDRTNRGACGFCASRTFTATRAALDAGDQGGRQPRLGSARGLRRPLLSGARTARRMEDPAPSSRAVRAGRGRSRPRADRPEQAECDLVKSSAIASSVCVRYSTSSARSS